MKKLALVIGFALGINGIAWAQNQSPTMNQSTTTTDTRGTAPTEDRSIKQEMEKNDVKKGAIKQRLGKGQIDDRRPTGNPKKLRSDSLRRGGATKVDTLR